MTDTSEPLLECWVIDLGDTVVRISHEEAERILPWLEMLSSRVIRVTDIYGCETWVMRDKIFIVSSNTIAQSAAARQRNRQFLAAMDVLDPDGAEKEWDK